MTLRERKKIQHDFFEAAAPPTAAFRALIDTLPDACFYMKDLNCRIMALNRRNCEVCNIKNVLDVIGMRSDEVFTPARKLLETTDMLLSDIAQEVGFYDQSHMTRTFKTIRHVTPGEYRRKHRAITQS